MNKRVFVGGLSLATLLAVFLPALSSGQPNQRTGEPQPEPALRLTFEYRDGRLALLETRKLKMVLPLPIKERLLKQGQSPSGYALELYDSNERVLLLREFDEDPLILVSETQDPKDPNRILRQETRQRSATFSVLVPAPPMAVSVKVTRPAPGQEALSFDKRSRETMGTFELDTHRDPKKPAEPRRRQGETS